MFFFSRHFFCIFAMGCECPFWKCWKGCTFKPVYCPPPKCWFGQGPYWKVWCQIQKCDIVLISHSGGDGQNLNVSAAFTHVIGDLCSSLGTKAFTFLCRAHSSGDPATKDYGRKFRMFQHFHPENMSLRKLHSFLVKEGYDHRDFFLCILTLTQCEYRK